MFVVLSVFKVTQSRKYIDIHNEYRKSKCFYFICLIHVAYIHLHFVLQSYQIWIIAHRKTLIVTPGVLNTSTNADCVDVKTVN